MQLMSKFNKGFRLLLCVIDTFSKYTWIIPLKDKKGVKITNAFRKNLNETNCKPNKIWVDRHSEIYNRSMKSFLKNNDIEMYSTHNEGKSVVAERPIRTIKNKIYKNNWKDPKFKIGDFIEISKYKNIFGKVCTPNLSEEVFAVKKVKITVL